MVARWHVIRRRQVEAEWHGAAAIVPRLCGRWPLRLHWRDNHGGRRDPAGDQADTQQFRSIFARSEAQKMECGLTKNGGSEITIFIVRSELRA